MLAKDYCYTYDGILSKADAYKDRGAKKNYTLLSRKDFVYPLYNSERLLEEMNALKHAMKEDIEKQLENKEIKESEVPEVLKQLWYKQKVKLVTDMPLRVIIETGYKENLIYNAQGKGKFVFDLSGFTRVVSKKEQKINDTIEIDGVVYEARHLMPKQMIMTFDLQ